MRNISKKRKEAWGFIEAGKRGSHLGVLQALQGKMERRLPAETRRRVCSFVVSWSVISEHRRVGRLLTPHSEVAQGSHQVQPRQYPRCLRCMLSVTEQLRGEQKPPSRMTQGPRNGLSRVLAGVVPMKLLIHLLRGGGKGQLFKGPGNETS